MASFTTVGRLATPCLSPGHRFDLSRLAFLTLLGVATAGVRGFAQNDDRYDLSRASLEELMNIRVTTASRGAESALTAAARVVVVTAAQIERRGYRSLLDVLKDLPDVKIDLNTDADTPADLTVQGVRGASRVLVQLDGFRVSSPTNEPLPILANYPVHEARQIEIVYGPSSSVYGADAFSAVINIISAGAAEAPGLRASISGGEDGLFNHTVRYAASLGDHVSLRLSGQYFSDRQPDLGSLYPDDFGGGGQKTGVFQTIFGPMTPSGQASPDYETPLTAHSLHAMVDVGSNVGIRVFESRLRTPNAMPYTFDNAVYNPESYQQNNLLTIGGFYRRERTRWRSLTTLSFSRQELDPQSGYWNVYSNLARSYKFAYGKSVRLMQQTTWRPSSTRTVTFGGTIARTLAIPQGADLNAPIVSRVTPGTILGTDIVDEFHEVRETNSGAFVQFQSPVGRGVAVTAGARGDYNSRYGGTFNPRIGLVAQGNGTTWKLLLGRAYLAPSAYQAYQHYGAFWSTDGGRTYESGYWHVPNPDLKPEHKTTLEGSVRHPLSEQVSLSASAFVSRLSNLIKAFDPDRTGPGMFLGWPVAQIEYPVNEGRGTMYGGTFGLDLLLHPRDDWRFEASAALSLVDGRFHKDDEIDVTTPVTGMAPLKAQFTADLDLGLWSVAPRLALVGAQRTGAVISASGDVTTWTIDGYALLDINVRRRNVVPGADIFVTIDNATDARYRHVNLRAYESAEEFIGVPQNPRRLAVGMSFRVPR